MEESNGELAVTVRAKNMPELRKKLLAILGEGEQQETAIDQDFPESIKNIFPGYAERAHGAAMLTVLREKHVEKENAVDSPTLAKEMIEKFPRLFAGKTFGEVSAGNVFSGNGLRKKNLIQIDLTEDESRMYWVKP